MNIDEEARNRSLFLLHLQAAVPLQIQALRCLDRDQLVVELEAARTDPSGRHHDAMLYGGTGCGAAAAAFARTLAVMALTAWGGVEFAGLHWCRTPGCRRPDDVDAHPQPYPPAPLPRQRPIDTVVTVGDML